MVELQLPKLIARVRFPSSAPLAPPPLRPRIPAILGHSLALTTRSESGQLGTLVYTFQTVLARYRRDLTSSQHPAQRRIAPTLGATVRSTAGGTAHPPHRSVPMVTLTRMSDAPESSGGPESTAGSAPSAKPAPVDRAYESAGALTIGVVLLVVGFALWTYGEHGHLAAVTEYEILRATLDSYVLTVPQRPDTVGWGIAIGILGLVLTTLGVYRLATHVDFLAQRAKNAGAGARREG